MVQYVRLNITLHWFVCCALASFTILIQWIVSRFLSSALSFVFFELLQNDDVREKATQEIDRVWKATHGKIQLDTLSQLL